jgi:hypothetical protein
MKYLMALSLAFLATTSPAQSTWGPEYYTANFQIMNVSPLCPQTVPNGATCMGYGSIVTVEATLGCGDELIFSRFEEEKSYENVDLYAISLVKRHPNSKVIRCIRANTIIKKVRVNSMGNINLINLSVLDN